MSAAKSCPDEKAVRSLLAGSLAQDETEVLTGHLEGCAACRKVLDRLAGVNDSWPAVAKCLARGQTPSSPALRQAMAELRRKDMSSAETLPPDPAQAAPPPSILLGHYEVRGLLGQGGMGKVYRAFDPNLHRVVAIKVMADSLAASGPARQRFMREARSAAVVTHENIVVIHEVNGSGDVPYLVMQFVAGQSLQDRIDKEGPLPLKDVVRIGMQTAAGLAAAHKQGLVHRDVKPANILLENGIERVKITDFGLARAVDDASLTQSGVIAGTPAYMSPEQANGEHVDHRSDLFSLGSVMYAMATGHPPFRAPNTMAVLIRVTQEEPRPIREVNPELPEWLEKVVAKLLHKDVKKRFQSADEVADLLGKALAKLQASEKPAKPRKRLVIAEAEEIEIPDTRPLRRPKKRSNLPWLLGGAAAAVLLLAAGLGLAWGLGAFSDKKNGGKTADPVKKEEDKGEWVQLFNGKDTSGWKTHPKQPGNWRVEGGELVSRDAAGYLFSERGDCENFHLRAEVLSSVGGNAGIWFRSSFDLLDKGKAKDGEQLYAPDGYEADLFWAGTVRPGRIKGLGEAADTQAPAGQWLTLEVIAQGPHLITLINGKKALDVTDAREEFQRGHLVLQAYTGATTVRFRKIEIKQLPSSPRPEWTPLFNGKDLTGWTRENDGPGNWTVVDGILSCSGESDHLYSQRDDHGDFHLRAEVRINQQGNSGIYFRAGKPLMLIGDYEAQITNHPNQKYKTGSLYGLVQETRILVPDDEWFTYEVIAQGNRIRLLVNGKQTADYVEQREDRRARGHLALQHHDAQTKVEFRKIQIKPLSAEWVPLFNGKDTSGWKTHPDQPGGWAVEGGNLVGRSDTANHLFSESGDYENFHLRVEAKVNKHGNGGIYFRCGYDVDRGGNPTGYEAQILHSYPRPGAPLTGSLYRLVNVLESRFETEDWFVMEVIAVGKRLTIKVNGVTTADHVDEANTHRKGHLALQVMSDKVVNAPTVLQFSKIEIKTLPASE